MGIQSIGARLTAWYTGILTLTFILLGATAYGLLAYSLSRDMDTALQGVAKAMAQKARSEDRAFFPSEIDDLFRRFFGFSPHGRQIDLFDPQRPGTGATELPISRKALENATRGLRTFETVNTAGAYPRRVLTMPVIDNGRVARLLRVGMSMENTIKTRRRFLLMMASVLPLGLVLAGSGGWLLARRALKPVDHMTQTARRISGEHIDARLHETGNGDEVDRLAKTLNDMLDRLDAALHQTRQFSADASHELQTPLTIIKGEMEVALRSDRTPQEYRRVLESALEEIERINRLVEGLLLLSRADAGVLRLDLHPVDIKELTAEVCDQMRGIADANAVAVDLNPMPSVFVPADRMHLRRVLLNLLDNAIKYTPEGGSVTFSLRSDQERAYLTITDTGIGLSAAHLERIFDRFHRVTDTRSADATGVGLGLSIARSIVEAHGGRIDVQRAPDRGAVFTVVLPLERSPA